MKRPVFVAILICALCVIGRAADEPAKLLSVSEASKLVLSALRPEYPFEARQKKLTGHGLILVKVSTTGNVTSATMRQRTGSAILDRAAIASLKHWRFRPGQAFYYEQPISYTRAAHPTRTPELLKRHTPNQALQPTPARLVSLLSDGFKH